MIAFEIGKKTDEKYYLIKKEISIIKPRCQCFQYFFVHHYSFNVFFIIKWLDQSGIYNYVN